MRIEPAIIAWRSDGTPCAPAYDDIYHSAGGGLAQARAVFLGGTSAAERWAGRPLFTIFETGFGIGLNFLATWLAWRGDPARCGRLHYCAVEKHPPRLEDLAACHAREPEIAGLAAELRAQWPLPLPGMQRLRFDGGRVVLTLVHADIEAGLAMLDHGVDAFYLDGFAPDRNPRMWGAAVMKHCARLAAPGATLATYTAARVVRENLAAAGFAVERLPGHGRKRHRLAACFRPPSWQPQRAAAAPAAQSGSTVIVIGAGLAGAAVAAALAARGHPVTVLEAAGAAATGASGIGAGTFHPHLSPDDARLSQLIRSAFLLALADWQALQRAGHALPGARDGLAQPAHDDEEEKAMRATAAALQWPAAHAEFLERDALRERCGLPLARGGWWYPQGGWLAPPALVAAQLARPGVQLRCHARVASLAQAGGQWRALDAQGRVLAEAALAVIAGGSGAAALAPGADAVTCVRGQLSYVPEDAVPGLRCAVASRGYLARLGDGRVALGSSYDAHDDDPAVRAGDHARNLALLDTLCTGIRSPQFAAIGGYTGFRASTPDHCPLIGALPDAAAAAAAVAEKRGLPLGALPRRASLYGAFGYGSRGLLWSALGAEMLACLIAGEPPPLPAPLLAAVDPARRLLHRLRRGGTA